MSDGTSRARGGVWFFLAMAFGISWGTFAIRRAATWPEPIDEFLRLTIKFGPSLAGLLAALHVSGLAGLRSLLSRLVIPCPKPGWLALAFLLPIAILLVALAGRVLIGGSVLPAGLTFVEASGLFFTLLVLAVWAAVAGVIAFTMSPHCASVGR